MKANSARYNRDGRAWASPGPTIPNREQMNQTVSIPIRVLRPHEDESRTTESKTAVSTPADHLAEQRWPAAEARLAEGTPEPATSDVEESRASEIDAEPELEKWRDRALRLQAEMENFRRRQRRLAQDQIQTERERLLGAFLPVQDDLERALASPVGDSEGLRQGVQLTHRALAHILQKEGVERLHAEGQPFDPAWHEAVATVRRNGTKAQLNTVVQVTEPGYRIGDRLLRPAKVVVAV